MRDAQSELTTRPLYVPDAKQIARDYVPTYHPRYDPSAWRPRIENAPIGMPDYSHLTYPEPSS